MSLDGSVIDLSVSMYDWAKYRRTKGAIKLHLLLDHDGYLPSFAVVTEGKTSEIKVARTLRFEPGTILAIDRGYNDYEWFRELTRQEVYFVTRMKEGAVYEVKEELEVPQNSNVVSDQIICFPRLAPGGRRAGAVPSRGTLGRGEAGVHRIPLEPVGLWRDHHRRHLQGALANRRVQTKDTSSSR